MKTRRLRRCGMKLSVLALVTLVGHANASWGEGDAVRIQGGHGPLGGGAGSGAVPVAFADLFGDGPNDLFLSDGSVYRWIGSTGDGDLLYEPVGEPDVDWEAGFRLGAILDDGGVTRAYFRSGAEILHATYSPSTNSYTEAGRIDLSGGALAAAGQAIQSMAVMENSDESVSLLLAYPDRPYLPAGMDFGSPDFIAYDGAGIWEGNTPEAALHQVRFSGPDLAMNIHGQGLGNVSPKVLLGIQSLAPTAAVAGFPNRILAGTDLGRVVMLTETSAFGLTGTSANVARGEDGNVYRNPLGAVTAIPFAHPLTSLPAILLATERGTDFYSVTGWGESFRIERAGSLVQEDPLARPGRWAALGGGDLLSDGRHWLVAGNAHGELLHGEVTDDGLAELLPIPFEGGGYKMEAGYWGSLMGPRDARLGYTAPAVFDWSGDGLPDILFSIVYPEYHVALNVSGDGPLLFSDPVPIFVDGMELVGTWRNQPAVTDWGGAQPPSLVTFDEEGALASHARMDNQNVARGERLLMEDGSPILADELASARTGGVRIQVVDLDEDGVLDLLLGVAGIHSVPAPGTGLPANGGEGGPALLFLRNVGTNADPSFSFPEVVEAALPPAGDTSVPPAPYPFRNEKGEMELFLGVENGLLFRYGRSDDAGVGNFWLLTAR